MGISMNEYNLLIVAATPLKHLSAYILLGAIHVGYLMWENYNYKIVAIYNLRRHILCNVS